MEPKTPAAPASALEVRDQLAETLELDLVGPWPDHDLEREKLPGWVRPSNWYLTGFLIPVDAPDNESADDDADEDIDAVPESEGLPEENTEEHSSAKKGFFPSSCGVSTLVAAEAVSLKVRVRWGDYVYVHAEKDGEADSSDKQRKVPVWQRIPRERKLEVRPPFGTTCCDSRPRIRWA